MEGTLPYNMVDGVKHPHPNILAPARDAASAYAKL